ncbi:MAG: carboxypeptidase-like regulatory domain-containing protein [Bacteroidia bacterium]|nr:carboxypeptidase-like regulatory domain-containing protein [Bacteroidia bacterium]
MLISQDFKGTIYGEVIDISSEYPIAFANVSLINSEMEKGTHTDEKGRFSLQGLPPGRYDLKIRYLGYEPKIISGILVSTARNSQITVRLQESALEMEEVVIRPKQEKEKALNSMATVSAKQLSMEEANRFAGGFDDPARLVSSFAGVAASNISSNGIVIRGNSPKGVLWRLEGVNIPNPNHFAEITGFGGGGITGLSSKMLGNSDFFTGAFPAEYGNALSGVFDLQIRKGNNQEYEHSFQAGFMGLDISSEGPLSKQHKSSYLFNYRYSTFGLIDVFLPGGELGIAYQDLSFKLNLPTENAGIFSIWALGLIDEAKSSPDTDTLEADSKWQYYDDIAFENSKLSTGIIGLNHKYWLNEKGYIKSSLTASSNRIDSKNGRLGEDLLTEVRTDEILYNNNQIQLSSLFNYKFNASHTHRSGFNLSRLGYEFDLQEANLPNPQLTSFAADMGNSYLLQAYSQSSFRLGEKLSLNPGLHLQYFFLNNRYSIEPRFSSSYQINDRHSLSLGYGLHSQLEKLSIYLADIPADTHSVQANRDLKLGKSHHLVLSYDWMLTDHVHVRIEPYYQRLFDIPVVEGSYFSTLNLTEDFFINDALVNEGTGENIGLDLTLERFLHKGWYYLITASVFDSRYTGGDGIERESRFNRNFISNVLFGKEWSLKKNRLFNISAKYTYLGGNLTHPHNETASLAAREIIEDLSSPYSLRNPDSHITSLTFTYRSNKKKHSNHWSLQILNVLGAKEYKGYQYNFLTNKIEQNTDRIIVPNLSYKIEF